jgi:hypothetical protein
MRRAKTPLKASRVIGTAAGNTSPWTSISCPDCGLVLRVIDDAAGFKCAYDMRDWRRFCARVDLGDAAWCLIQRDGTYPMSTAMNGGSCHRNALRQLGDVAFAGYQKWIKPR